MFEFDFTVLISDCPDVILWLPRVLLTVKIFLESFIFALLILVRKFFNHFGGTAIFVEVHNVCELLKTHFGR